MIPVFFNINIFLASVLCLMHPVHVSVTNVSLYPGQQKIEVSSKVFKKDFTLLLYHLYELNIDLDNAEQLNENSNRINEYFINHFKIKTSKKGNCRLNLKEITTSGEYLWLYYEVDIEKGTKQLEVVNTILLDLYFDQKNMLIFGYNEAEQGYLFNLKQTKHTINLDEF